MADVEFRIVHVDHDNVTIATHYPTGDSLRWGYRATDVGDVAYDLALSDPSLVAAGADSFAPYKTDWRLGMNVDGLGWNTIHAGIHTHINIKSRSGEVAVQGKDWAHWLEQPVWFTFYATQWNLGQLDTIVRTWSTGVKDADFNAQGFYENFAVKAWVGDLGATQRSVITDLVNGSHVGTDFVNLAANFNSTPKWDSLLHYEIFVQDETNILDHIKTIASLSDPYGYDFYTDWDKTMYFFGPRKTVGTTTPAWTLTDENVVKESVPDFDWTNDGPLGTYMVGLGPGSPALWHLKYHQPTIDLYRQWLRVVRVGDIYASKIDGVRQGTMGLQFGYPHKDLKLTVKPEKLKPLDKSDGFKNHCGDVVHFVWPIPPYHTIDAYFWITQQDFRGDGAGNWYCDLGLEQIYE